MVGLISREHGGKCLWIRVAKCSGHVEAGLVSGCPLK